MVTCASHANRSRVHQYGFWSILEKSFYRCPKLADVKLSRICHVCHVNFFCVRGARVPLESDHISPSRKPSCLP